MEHYHLVWSGKYGMSACSVIPEKRLLGYSSLAAWDRRTICKICLAGNHVMWAWNIFSLRIAGVVENFRLCVCVCMLTCCMP
jgi:hypothetical protein